MLKTLGRTIFVAVELTLLLLIVLLKDATTTNALCFCSVVLAFAYSLCWHKQAKFNWLLSLALFFTTCADFCLVLLNPAPQLLAMIFFSFVQLAYFVYLLLRENKKQVIVHCVVRLVVVLSALIATALVLGKLCDALSLISMFYFANLLTNIIFSFAHKSTWLLAIGFVSFVCCDALVGLGVGNGIYFSINEASLLYKIVYPQFNLIWIFYIISQTLISLFASLQNRNAWAKKYPFSLK